LENPVQNPPWLNAFFQGEMHEKGSELEVLKTPYFLHAAIPSGFYVRGLEQRLGMGGTGPS
jgi:hypothetical protein